jgi:peptidoglycan hydrolase CwlO-like protein
MEEITKLYLENRQLKQEIKWLKLDIKIRDKTIVELKKLLQGYKDLYKSK